MFNGKQYSSSNHQFFFDYLFENFSLPKYVLFKQYLIRIINANLLLMLLWTWTKQTNSLSNQLGENSRSAESNTGESQHRTVGNVECDERGLEPRPRNGVVFSQHCLTRLPVSTFVRYVGRKLFDSLQALWSLWWVNGWMESFKLGL